MDAVTLDRDQIGTVRSNSVDTVTAGDGYELSYRTWRPEGPSRGTIVLFNGIMSHAGWFEPLVQPLTHAGFVLVGADRRGSGLNEAARGDAPSAKDIVADALAIIDDAVPDGEPLLVAGWCWGAILALNLLRPLRGRASGLALLTPGLFPTQEVIDAAMQADQAAGSGADGALVDVPISDTMFTRGPCLDEFVRQDPLKLKATTRRFLAHTKKLAMGARMALRKLSLPTLVVLAEDDEATNNEAVDAAMESLSVTLQTIPGAHGLQFDAPEALADSLSAFFGSLLDVH